MRPHWLLALACLALPACSNEPLDVAPDVDLPSFQGKWFEIAKLPRATQADCTGTIAFYKAREGGMDVINECHLKKLDGELRSSVARLYASGEGEAAKLSIDVHGFVGDYWILEVGDHYEYAVIGVPARDYLWILSRTPTMDEETLDGVLARTRAKKFDTSRLEYTLQGSGEDDPDPTALPEAKDLQSARYGCAWSGEAGGGWGALGALAALAAIVSRRRRA
jgi:apolipoprotein D and lipocalin family protein